VRKGLAAACLLFASCIVYAQEADTLSAALVYGVKSLPVLRATEEVRVDAVWAPPSVADVVRRFTGVQVKDYGGVGGLKTVNVRSLGSEHVGVFMDGIQIDNAQNMQVDLGRFSMEGFSTVSLYSVQKSRRLQTAKEYASGAALYLNSERPREDALRLRLRGGSFATVNPAVTWEKASAPLALRLSGEFLSSNGRYPYDYFGETLTRENGDIRSLRLEAKLYGMVNTTGQWDIHAYSYGSERGFPGPVIRRAPEYPFSAERQADQDLLVQGSWTQDWSARYSTALRAKYANNYTHYDTHPELNPMAMPYDLHYRQQSGYLSLAHSYVLAAPWSLDLSTDVQHNALDSDSYQAVNPRRTTFTGVIASRLAWEKFRAEAHIVYQGAWDCFGDGEGNPWAHEDAFRDAWMPGATICWYPLRDASIAAYAKRSFRLPSFNDLYYSQVGNANLKPEEAMQVGADIRFGREWNIRISPYFNRVANKIVAIPTSSQFRWTMLNIGIVDITGLDVSASGRLKAGEWQMGATLRYTYQRALDHSVISSEAEKSPNYGNQIPYVPRHSGSIDLDASWRSWSLTWNTVLTGERWSRSANTADYRIDPWSTSDAAVKWEKDLSTALEMTRGKVGMTRGKVGIKTLSLSLHVNNIFNRRYQIVQGYPMPGTNVMLTIGCGF